MFCPSCRAEFREGIERCPDCDVDLVHDEPPAPGEPERKLVGVFRTAEPELLPILKGLLESSGIPYTIRGEELLGLFPGTGIGLAIDTHSRAAEVQVPAERAEEARRLLATVDLEEPESDDEE